MKKKSRIIATKQAKRKLAILGTIIVVIIMAIAIAVAVYLNAKKNTIDVTSHGYETNSNDTTTNTLIVDVTKNEINENTIVENNVIDNNVANNTTSQNNNKTNNSGTTKYKLEVNCTANVVNVYEQDENGEYTKCVKVMLCSIGSATPHSGTYSLKKYGGASWRWRALFGNVYGQYATQITGNILFHSVPYTKPNNSDLEYWEYDKLGTAASMGCVRLTVQNAKWIWDNCAAGTKVRFYDDSNPGPLGKPAEAKISWNEECRNWDPTDPDQNNPWKSYNNKQESNKPQESNQVPENKPQGNNTVPEDKAQEDNTASEDKPQENNTASEDNPQENNPAPKDQPQESKPAQDGNKTQEENTTKDTDTKQNTVNNNNAKNNNNAGNNKGFV